MAGASVEVRRNNRARNRAKFQAMPPAIARRVAQATRTNAREYLGEVDLGTPRGVTGRLARSNRMQMVAGSVGTAWRVSSGGLDKFYGHIADGGSKAGVRKIKRGKRRGQSFYHPGTRATRYFRGPQRRNRLRYRRRMLKAYREGARAV